MFKTSDFTQFENIDLSKEIQVVNPIESPFYSYLLSKGLTDTTGSKVTTWRQKTYDKTDDVSVKEGASADTTYKSGRAEKNNICEIFMKPVEISASAQASDVTGQTTNQMAEEVNDRLAEVKMNIEKQMINGEKDDGSTDPYIRRMDGILNFVPSENIITYSGNVDESHFKDTVRAIWEQGFPSATYVGMCNAGMKENVDGIYEDKYSYIAQEELFGMVVRRIQTNYGNVLMLLNRHMPANKLVIFNPEMFRVSYLRKPRFEPLAKNGDFVRGMVVAELTLKCYNENAISVFEDTSS